MLAPINSNKHYVHNTNAVIASGAVRSSTLVDAVVAPATSNAFDVEEGSLVKAIWVEHWLLGNGAAGTNTQFTLIVEKCPSNIASATAAEMANLGAYTNKKNIMFSSQGVIGSGKDGQSAIPIIRNWLKIPKGKQRMGLSDRIVLTILATGTILQDCGIQTYKEYR